MGVKVRFADFNSLTRDVSTGDFLRTADEILRAARACLKKIPFEEKGGRSTIRLLGIRASHLISPEDAETERLARRTRLQKGGVQMDLDLEDGP